MNNKIEHIRDLLRKYDYHYYVLDAPLVTDSEYDSLFLSLVQLENQYPNLITSDSPTQRIGATADNTFAPVQHYKKMYSLSNVFSEHDLELFLQRMSKSLNIEISALEMVCEPKLDGLAVNLIYQNGFLVKAATRGDGSVGEDVTANIKTINAVPLKLLTKKPPKILEIRGEVYISKSGFENLNKHNQQSGEKIFANPRNAAAGSLRQLNPSITNQRPLEIYCYDIGYSEDFDLPDKHNLKLMLLKKLGLRVSDLNKTVLGLAGCMRYYNDILLKRDTLPYEIDGVVYKLNDTGAQNILGYVARAPRFACAHKFPALEGVSQILSVDFQVGRTGVLTPVARVKPVLVSGVVISNITLHNMDDIGRKDLHINDWVIVRRAGDVIPEIVSVIRERRSDVNKIVAPKFCPVCHSSVMQDDTALRCTGELSCPAQLKRSITHFASRKAMNIDGLGPAIVNTLVSHKIIHDVADLYVLSKNDLACLPNFADKSIDNLLSSISHSKKTTLSRFIFALGIHEIGEVTAKILAKNFDNIHNLMQADLNFLLTIENIGPTIAKNIVNFFKNKNNYQIIKKLLAHGVCFEIEVIGNTNQDNFFNNKTVVITGTLSTIKREELINILSQNGANISNSVSKKTNYLIVGDNPGSKYNKAKELEVQIIDEAKLLEIFPNIA